MPRDTAGNYNLPAGNPVASGEIISASWANSTMNDLGQSLSASLDRYGRGGMLAPFQFTDGTESAPGATWSNEPTTGLYRAAYGDLRFTLTGTDVQRWTNANSYLWRNSQWEEILTQTGGGGDTTINNLVVTGSFTSPGIDDNATSTAITIDSSQRVGIGTSAPVSYQQGPVLNIGDTSDSYAQLNFTTATDGVQYIGFGDSTTTSGRYQGLISFDHSTNKMGFGTGASTTSNMTITSSGNVGIGTESPSTLTVHNNISVGDGTSVTQIAMNRNNANYLAALDPAGFLVFRTGGNNERMRITADGNTGVTGGFTAAQPGAGFLSFAAGSSAGLTGQGSNAVAIGRESGQTNQGTSGVAMGYAAGGVGQGDYSVAVGYVAGNDDQGANAVAVGYTAGRTTQGTLALAVGNAAGNDNQGAYAVALGHQAGKTSQGTHSIAIGRDVGFTGQGIECIAIGRGAGYSGQGDYSVAIGNGAGQSNQGANGIIISTRGVAENITGANHIMLTSGAGKYLYYNGTNTWAFSGGDVTVPNDSLLVGMTSAVALGTANTGHVLNSNGILDVAYGGATGTDCVRFWGAAGFMGSIERDGALTVAYRTSSDERLKENIRPSKDALPVLMQVPIDQFEWKEGGEHVEFGAIAQKWREVIPEAVSKSDDPDKVLGVEYSRPVPMLIKAMQEQQAMIETLQAEVAALKGA